MFSCICSELSSSSKCLVLPAHRGTHLHLGCLTLCEHLLLLNIINIYHQTLSHIMKICPPLDHHFGDGISFPWSGWKKSNILPNFTDLPDWEMRAKDNNWMGRHNTSDEGDWKIFPCKIYTIVISRVNTDALCWAHLVDFSCKTHPVYSKLCKRFVANLNLNKFSSTFE